MTRVFGGIFFIWRVPQEQLANCVFYNDERVQDAMVASRKRMRCQCKKAGSINV